MRAKIVFTSVVTAVICIVGGHSPAQNLIANGGFESGFTGWTLFDQTGSEGTWSIQTGTTSPVNGFTVPAPPDPTQAAMTDAQGPGSHSLVQNFIVPSLPTGANLQFDLYINNHATAFFSPASLDFSTAALNQQFRVDIMTAAADPFSVSMTDVLLNVYQTQPGDPLVSGYNTINSDLTALFAAHPGETLRLRLAAVDNVNFLNIGIDRVSIAVPEPGAVILFASGLVIFAGRLIRRRKNS